MNINCHRQWEVIMNIYQMAMEMEHDGKALYQDLSAKTANPGIKGVLDELGRMEENHYHVFEAMAAHNFPVGVQELSMASVGTVFKEMPEYFELESDIQTEVQLYRKALDIERKSEGEYTRLASLAESEAEKKQIMAIAGEEHKHIKVLEQIIEFIQAPAEHTVNAEFSNDGDY